MDRALDCGFYWNDKWCEGATGNLTIFLKSELELWHRVGG